MGETTIQPIREQDPLKQGLKLHWNLYRPFSKQYSRARSIKTRIETPIYIFLQYYYNMIREQDPLKQGLKQLKTGELKQKL